MKLPTYSMALGALLLVSCAPERSANQAESSTDAADPAAPATPVPPQADLQPEPMANASAPLTAQGWGPLRIGMTLAEVTRVLGPDANPDAVGGPDPESCDQFRPERAPKGMLVMIEDGRLTSVSLIDDSPIATDRGLRVGDDAAAVTKAYGAELVTSPHKYQDPPAAYLTWWTTGPKDDWVQDVAARGIRYVLGGEGTVETIQAGGPSIQYVEGCA
ncbi:hypothetical protein [Sphingosinicella rhizophila]|uniref:Serine/threonine protein kinase n=1 Tax=Sphingosinicella rhizophila TaxID=3050082 RepID=A0ABU3Q9S9_9SPHN|nr:hypothetical protein [Sphingosinicella sp. GR2756]MDT9600165.1 hypothetical protein [Sphingosinicella sp. GR2756]